MIIASQNEISMRCWMPIAKDVVSRRDMHMPARQVGDDLLRRLRIERLGTLAARIPRQPVGAVGASAVGELGVEQQLS